jgi:hypothetical protein
MSARDFVDLDRRELMARLRAGHAIDPHALDDSEYRGTSLGLPGFVEKLSWKVFRKTFCRDPELGVLRGWNVRLEQNGLDGPSVPMTKAGESVTFGHYRVVEPGAVRLPPGCDRGLVIHYGLGGNGTSPIARVRDPVVALTAGSVERLLGWSYVDLGITLLGTPSFFLLEREGPLSERVRPPGTG